MCTLNSTPEAEGGREHVVKVIDGNAEFKRGRGGKLLLRIKIAAEVDGVLRGYEITYSRRGANNAAVGFAVARADAPGGREADAKRPCEGPYGRGAENTPEERRHHRD
jgi:hypothetical protein